MPLTPKRLFLRRSAIVPPIISETIAWLREKQCLDVEGIFRITGNYDLIKSVKNKYYKGKAVDLDRIDNVHVIAGVLKAFFRDLSEPLLTFGLYNDFIAALDQKGLYLQLEHMSKVLNLLPEKNYAILREILSFLKELSKHPKNRMNVKNLAIIFAPNLLRSPNQSSKYILNSYCLNIKIVELLIKYQPYLILGERLNLIDFQEEDQHTFHSQSKENADTSDDPKNHPQTQPEFNMIKENLLFFYDSLKNGSHSAKP